jgi:hypothetical protein
MTSAIQQYLPEHLWNLAAEFDIPLVFLENNSSLIQLILESKSLSEHTEKQNWFNLLPIMSQEQVDKLNDILTREKQKLEEINEKYAKKQEEINKKYQQSYNPETYYQNQAKIKEEESKTRDQELVEADNLLTQI